MHPGPHRLSRHDSNLKAAIRIRTKTETSDGQAEVLKDIIRQHPALVSNVDRFKSTRDTVGVGCTSATHAMCFTIVPDPNISHDDVMRMMGGLLKRAAYADIPACPSLIPKDYKHANSRIEMCDPRGRYPHTPLAIVYPYGKTPGGVDMFNNRVNFDSWYLSQYLYPKKIGMCEFAPGDVPRRVHPTDVVRVSAMFLATTLESIGVRYSPIHIKTMESIKLPVVLCDLILEYVSPMVANNAGNDTHNSQMAKLMLESARNYIDHQGTPDMSLQNIKKVMHSIGAATDLRDDVDAGKMGELIKLRQETTPKVWIEAWRQLSIKNPELTERDTGVASITEFFGLMMVGGKLLDPAVLIRLVTVHALRNITTIYGMGQFTDATQLSEHVLEHAGKPLLHAIREAVCNYQIAKMVMEGLEPQKIYRGAYILRAQHGHVQSIATLIALIVPEAKVSDMMFADVIAQTVTNSWGVTLHADFMRKSMEPTAIPEIIAGNIVRIDEECNRMLAEFGAMDATLAPAPVVCARPVDLNLDDPGCEEIEVPHVPRNL